MRVPGLGLVLLARIPSFTRVQYMRFPARLLGDSPIEPRIFWPRRLPLPLWVFAGF